jgi:cellobiose epimerase
MSHQSFMVDSAFKSDLRARIEAELLGNILPFWIAHTPDEANGGFYGALTNDLRILNDVPRSAVLCARILWTYAAAYRTYGQPDMLAMAQRAYVYLCERFWDPQHGGVYWTIDAQGRPLDPRKYSYAQAFATYGLAEFYRATHEPASLRLAQELFALLDRYSHDSAYGGYVEGCGQDWGTAPDVRLSEKEPDARKSMNTMLHIMEAYANLLRVWDHDQLRARLAETIQIFLEYVLDARTQHFKLFFDDRWNAQPAEASYGHDIEGSWLLVEAAEILGDAVLLSQARAGALAMAQATYAEGRDADGGLVNEGQAGDWTDTDKHWWVQGEALVGFYNAYQLSGQSHFAAAARDSWALIEAKFVDRQHGDWFKVLNRAGVPDRQRYKTGPWECPYHHSRACLEMIERLGQ